MSAFTLTRDEQQQLATATKALDEALAFIADAQRRREETIAAADHGVRMAVDIYNRALGEAEQLVDGIAQRLRDAYDEKSERWQEGDAGQAALAFVEEYENANLEEIHDEGTICPDRAASGHAGLAQLPVDAD